MATAPHRPTQRIEEIPGPEPVPVPVPIDLSTVKVYRMLTWNGDKTPRDHLVLNGVQFFKGEPTSMEHLPYHVVRQMIIDATRDPDWTVE